MKAALVYLLPAISFSEECHKISDKDKGLLSTWLGIFEAVLQSPCISYNILEQLTGEGGMRR